MPMVLCFRAPDPAARGGAVWTIIPYFSEDGSAAEQICAPPKSAAPARKCGGWCGMTDCAEDVLRYKALLADPEQDVKEVLVDLIYWVNRMSMWIDLLIPWEDITNLMRRP